MKKNYTLIIAVLLFAFNSNAQLLNGSFENWTNNGTFSDPDHWYSYNYVTTNFGVLNCEEGTPGNPGAKYVKLTSRNIPGIGVLPGNLTSGEYDNSTGIYLIGFPFNQRPASFTGSWQYVPGSGDQGYVYIYLFKWNTATQTQDIVSLTTYDLIGSEVNWTNFDIPLDYFSSDVPDTCSIIFSSSGAGSGTIVDGSYLYIDNLAFAGTSAGIINTNAQDFVQIFPNPAKQFVYVVQNNPSLETKYVITSIDGKKVQEGTITGTKAKLELNNISKGIYLLQLTNDNKKTTKRLFVE